jgi:hypothetical protein
METEFHQELKSKVLRFLTREGWSSALEVVLPNNKLADVLGVNHREDIIIVEVKTTVHKYYIQEAYDKYAAFCDVLYLAGPSLEVRSAIWPPTLLEWRQTARDVGLIELTNTGVTVLRGATRGIVPADRRQAVIEIARKGRLGW